MACPPENEVKQRLGKALREADILHGNYCSKWIGRDVEILVEQKIKDEVRGLARNYIRIAAISETAEIGEEIKVTPRKYINGILTSAPGSKCTPDNPEFPEFL